MLVRYVLAHKMNSFLAQLNQRVSVVLLNTDLSVSMLLTLSIIINALHVPPNFRDMGLIWFLWFRWLSICKPWKFVSTNSCMYFSIYPVVNAHCGKLFIRCCLVLNPDLVPACYHYTSYSYTRVLDLSLYRNWHCTRKDNMSLVNFMVSDKV
jgi:hypothetical protein